MGNIKHDGNTNKTIDEAIEQFISTNINATKVRYTAHHLKWSWKINGTTKRIPNKLVKLGRGLGWERKIYYFNGATIIINLYTLELWLKSRYYNPTRKASGTIRMIYANWNKADKIAREFSEFAQIAITPIRSEHPADIQHAHLVMTTKELNPILKPMSEVKDKVGLTFDKSHPNLPEFTGEKSVEGAQGAEWFFTKFPAIVQYQVEMDKRYAENLELHLKVLEEIREAIKRLNK
jgi:hypothetical protein